MNSTKVFFVIAFLGACCVLAAQSLSCYTCNGVSSCKDPSKTVCTTQLANNTRSYLAQHYMNVDTNKTGTSFTCLSDWFYVNSTRQEQQYKGCAHSSMNACGLILNYSGVTTRTCKECNSDYCNPAGRAGISAITLFGAVSLVTLTLKYLTH